MSVAGLDPAWRAELGERARRLWGAARYVATACEAHGEASPAELTTWPSTPRRSGGWARATDGDEAEDERLHDVIAVGRHVVASLARRAGPDPTVQLAWAHFEYSAELYERSSMTAHARLRDPGLPVGDAAYEVHAGVTELLRAIRDAEQIERGMLAIRLVPPGLTVAASHLRNDLADLVEPPDDGALYDPAQLRLVRHLDGTLGIVQDRADCLPESVLAASAIAAAALDGWDRATGSFRAASGRETVGEVSHIAGAGRAASPDAELLARTAAEMAQRVEIVVDTALDARRSRNGVLPLEALQTLARESRVLHEGGLAPLGPAARDSVHRDHAARLGQAALDLAADHLDTVDPAQLLVGRAALEAGRAAQEYLTLSDATAASVRSQRMELPSGDCGGGRLEAAAAVWRRLDQALRGDPLSDVAAAEWCAFTADLKWAGAARNGPPSTAREVQLRLVAIDHRLADSLCGLVRGDLGAHLATLPEGRHVLSVVEATSERFDTELGLARSPTRAPDRQAGEWLAAEGDDGYAPTHAAAQVRRAQACRNALGRAAARDSGRTAGV